MPHTTTDPLVCLASAVTGLQSIVARNVAPTEAGVVSTTFVRGGSAYNIIPGEAELGGTLRSLTKEGYDVLEERTAAVLGGAASMLSCRLNLTLSSFAADCTRRAAPAGAPGACTFPPTVNHAAGWAEARRAALRLVDAEDVIEVPPTMAGEIDR